MLRHLRLDWEEQPDGRKVGRYANPDEDYNWVDDPCTYCGGESFGARCEADGSNHHHGAVHGAGWRSGFVYLCRSPECLAKYREELAVWRSDNAMLREIANKG